MIRLRKALLAGAISSCAALAGVPALAQADNTFSGSCGTDEFNNSGISGTATFQPNLTNTTRPTDYAFNGTGKCTGTLNGAKVENAPISAHVAGRGNLSCPSGENHSTPGSGDITFTRGPGAADDIAFPINNFDFTATAGDVQFTAKGSKGGTANGRAQFLTTQKDPIATLTACGAAGLSSLDFLAYTQSDTTLQSAENPGGGAGGGGGGTAERPDTKITKVKVKGNKATVSFQGSGGQGQLTYKCKLDKKAFKACKSPATFKHLKPGPHTVQVEAIDSQGDVDQKPAKKGFRV